MLRSSVSSAVPEVCIVVRAVLTVFTCLSIKPLDLGYMGDEVICSMVCFDINLARRKGGFVIGEIPLRQPILGDDLL